MNNQQRTVHRRRRRQKNSKIANSHKLICFVAVFVLAIAVTLEVRSLETKSKVYEAQIIELQAQVHKAEEDAKDIEVLSKYVKTDEYVESVARDKLGMAHEGEIILKGK
jgi:cell division protein DivIC